MRRFAPSVGLILRGFGKRRAARCCSVNGSGATSSSRSDCAAFSELLESMKRLDDASDFTFKLHVWMGQSYATPFDDPVQRDKIFRSIVSALGYFQNFPFLATFAAAYISHFKPSTEAMLVVFREFDKACAFQDAMRLYNAMKGFTEAIPDEIVKFLLAFAVRTQQTSCIAALLEEVVQRGLSLTPIEYRDILLVLVKGPVQHWRSALLSRRSVGVPWSAKLLALRLDCAVARGIRWVCERFIFLIIVFFMLVVVNLLHYYVRPTQIAKEERLMKEARAMRLQMQGNVENITETKYFPGREQKQR